MSLSIRSNGNAITESPFGGKLDQSTLKFKGPEQDTKNIVPYLAKELGVELQARRNDAQISALTDPKKWLDTYNGRMTSILGTLAERLRDKTDQYGQVYPMDQAIALAQRDIAVLFEMEKRQLEIEYPGAELLFKQAEVKSFLNYNDKGGSAMLSTIEQDGKQDKAAYRRYKAKKKAKRSTKA